MRPRFAVLALPLAAAAAAAAPSVASAHHPHYNRGLTIAATPNPIDAGSGVLIYGALRGGPDLGGQTISLYHHIPGHPGYQFVQRTTTNSEGFYEIPRADGVVETNRNWFVRGPGLTHSRTVREYVSSDVGLSSSSANVDTRHAVTFTGSVAPAGHVGQVVRLQKENADGGWATIGYARVTAGSQFTINHVWRVPGVYTVRALLPGNRENTAGTSDALTITVQQTQVTGFTINSSDPIISEGQSATISGVLDQPGSNAVEPNTQVALYGRTPGGAFAEVGSPMMTGQDGSYSFSVSPTGNMVYQVRTVGIPMMRASAALFQGVQDTVTMGASTTSPSIGTPVTFTGSVTPDAAGHAVYLERQAQNGDWVAVGYGTVQSDGSFTFSRSFGLAGTRVFRARVIGEPENVGGASSPVTVTVSGTVAPASSLPAAPAA